VFHLTELEASNTVKAFLVHAVGNCASGQKSASRKLEGNNHGKQLLSEGRNNARYFIGQNVVCTETCVQNRPCETVVSSLKQFSKNV
jgi:hypothetical protein